MAYQLLMDYTRIVNDCNNYFQCTIVFFLLNCIFYLSITVCLHSYIKYSNQKQIICTLNETDPSNHFPNNEVSLYSQFISILRKICIWPTTLANSSGSKTVFIFSLNQGVLAAIFLYPFEPYIHFGCQVFMGLLCHTG